MCDVVTSLVRSKKKAEADHAPAMIMRAKQRSARSAGHGVSQAPAPGRVRPGQVALFGQNQGPRKPQPEGSLAASEVRQAIRVEVPLPQ
jgi:hypothetical protein